MEKDEHNYILHTVTFLDSINSKHCTFLDSKKYTTFRGDRIAIPTIILEENLSKKEGRLPKFIKTAQNIDEIREIKNMNKLQISK